ncbi:hypothetical protein [Aquimarina algiphila]|uniref:hypothetical protein n=1 Tax=Aquimarina algiphila TaxID=2047982 RepID=UPI00232DAA5F|nr:hypothetical protein [Aquimarina algiphila]
MKETLTINKAKLKDKSKNFDDAWWDAFLAKTENLSKTTVFKDSLTKEETKEMRESLMEILRDLANLRTGRYGYRVYEDGVVLNEVEMNRIYDSPPLKDEPIDEWVKRTFGNKKFGMIINEGERFNLDLSKKMALRTKPLLDKVGFPKEGVNFSIFIGNYGWTPLGIHQDSAGENVIHFHLGPGPKTMYTWKDEEFRELVDVGTYDNHDVKPLLKHATEFKFEEGDLYFMPTGEFHIGHSDELSLSVTFWQYNHTKFRFARRIHNMIMDQFIKESEELVTPDRNELENTSGMQDVLSTFQFTDEMDDFSYKELLAEMYKDLRYSINSNAGYRTSPFPKTEEDSQLDINDAFIIETPFKIQYRESNDKIKLFAYVRGHKFSLNNFECIALMIDEINKGKEITVRQLLNILNEEWPEEIGLQILSLIYQNHGMVKV